jgi:hypothetical protein
MATLWFKIDQLSMLLVPEHGAVLVDGVGAISSRSSFRSDRILLLL